MILFLFSPVSICILPSCVKLFRTKADQWLIAENNASVHCGLNCFPSRFTPSSFSKHDINSQSSSDKQLFRNSSFQLFALWNW